MPWYDNGFFSFCGKIPVLSERLKRFSSSIDMSSLPSFNTACGSPRQSGRKLTGKPVKTDFTSVKVSSIVARLLSVALSE